MSSVTYLSSEIFCYYRDSSPVLKSFSFYSENKNIHVSLPVNSVKRIYAFLQRRESLQSFNMWRVRKVSLVTHISKINPFVLKTLASKATAILFGSEFANIMLKY